MSDIGKYEALDWIIYYFEDSFNYVCTCIFILFTFSEIAGLLITYFEDLNLILLPALGLDGKMLPNNVL